MAIGQVIPVSAVDERLAKVSADLAKLGQQIRDLELERDMLVRLRQSAVTPPPQNGTNSNASEQTARVRLPTAQAIYHVMSTEPGLRMSEIVNRAETILDSTSGDKRRLLYSALSTMKRKGRFDVDPSGGLHLKGTGQEQMPLTG